MFTTLTLVIYGAVLKASQVLPARRLPTITPRCDWANSLDNTGTNPIVYVVEEAYGLEMTYLPYVAVGAIIIAGLTIWLAWGKKIMFIALFIIAAIVFVPPIANAIPSIGNSPCAITQ